MPMHQFLYRTIQTACDRIRAECRDANSAEVTALAAWGEWISRKPK